MNLESTLNFYRKLQKDKFSFLYRGDFSHTITSQISDLGEFNLTRPGDLKKIKKRLSFIMAECFDNVVKHSTRPQVINVTNNKPSMFLARGTDQYFQISSVNLIENHQVEKLENRLQNINSLSREDLKELYFQILGNQQFTPEGGAGLGLIEMARKSERKLSYQFDFINFYLLLFYIQIVLPIKTGGAREPALQEVKLLYDFMNYEDIFFVHKGDFSHSTLVHILRMVDENLANLSEELSTRKRVLCLLIELLQNINHHGKKLDGSCEGILMLGKKDNKFMIYTGNLIDQSLVPSFRKRLDHISGQDQDILDDLYRNEMLRIKNSDSNTNLGLVDVARYSNEQLEYEFYPWQKDSAFFSLCATL